MFKIVTNLDHWHNLHESRDCTDVFKGAPVEGAGRLGFGSTLVRKSAGGIAGRDVVVVVVADTQTALWAIEALLRARLGGQVDDLLAVEDSRRQAALNQLRNIVTALDENTNATEGRTPRRTARKLATLAIPVLGGISVGYLLVAGFPPGRSDTAEQVRALSSQYRESQKELADWKKEMLQVQAETKAFMKDNREQIRRADQILAEAKPTLEALAKLLATGGIGPPDPAAALPAGAPTGVSPVEKDPPNPETLSGKASKVPGGTEPSEGPEGCEARSRRKAQGNEGQYTRALAVCRTQTRLAELGFLPADGVDGDWGTQTARAYAAFLKSRCSEHVGSIEKPTLREVEAALANLTGLQENTCESSDSDPRTELRPDRTDS